MKLSTSLFAMSIVPVFALGGTQSTDIAARADCRDSARKVNVSSLFAVPNQHRGCTVIFVAHAFAHDGGLYLSPSGDMEVIQFPVEMIEVRTLTRHGLSEKLASRLASGQMVSVIVNGVFDYRADRTGWPQRLRVWSATAEALDEFPRFTSGGELRLPIQERSTVELEDPEE